MRLRACTLEYYQAPFAATALSLLYMYIMTSSSHFSIDHLPLRWKRLSNTAT